MSSANRSTPPAPSLARQQDIAHLVDHLQIDLHRDIGGEILEDAGHHGVGIGGLREDVGIERDIEQRQARLAIGDIVGRVHVDDLPTRHGEAEGDVVAISVEEQDILVELRVAEAEAGFAELSGDARIDARVVALVRRRLIPNAGRYSL